MIYAYHCKCGHTKDVDHKIDEKPEIRCEECNDEMIKTLGSGAFIRKGTGWGG